jgi:hypothetical protein
MNRVLIAAVAVLGFAGVAVAQEAPELTGNYSANVLNNHSASSLSNGGNAPVAQQRTAVYSDAGFDRLETGSIARPAAQTRLYGNYDGTVTQFDIQSGQ